MDIEEMEEIVGVHVQDSTAQKLTIWDFVTIDRSRKWKVKPRGKLG